MHFVLRIDRKSVLKCFHNSTFHQWITINNSFVQNASHSVCKWKKYITWLQCVLLLFAIDFSIWHHPQFSFISLMYHYIHYFKCFIVSSMEFMLKLDIVYFDMYQLCTHRHWPGGLVWIKTWKVDVSMSRLMVVFCTITSTKACVSYAN